jgi:hypothetical protein
MGLGFRVQGYQDRESVIYFFRTHISTLFLERYDIKSNHKEFFDKIDAL